MHKDIYFCLYLITHCGATESWDIWTNRLAHLNRPNIMSELHVEDHCKLRLFYYLRAQNL